MKEIEIYRDPSSRRLGFQVREDRKLVWNEISRDTDIRKLRRHGLKTIDLSDNEMAKLHIRHLVGGRAPNAVDEILYRFEFPERPGALMNFLDKMGGRWNISLFHYRSHGADFGRVLVGMQVPRKAKRNFQKFLDNLGYEYVEETKNKAYRLFLS